MKDNNDCKEGTRSKVIWKGKGKTKRTLRLETMTNLQMKVLAERQSSRQAARLSTSRTCTQHHILA
jgi:hypothetical protein